MANIGDRIRGLREERDLSQGDIEKRTGLLRCYISVSKTVTRFLLSRRWRSWPERWNCQCIGCSMMANSLPNCRILSVTFPGPVSSGARLERTLYICQNYDVVSVVLMNVIENF
jgi:hypothetical protein